MRQNQVLDCFSLLFGIKKAYRSFATLYCNKKIKRKEIGANFDKKS